MSVVYQILVVHSDRPDWLASLRQAVANELTDLGVHKSLSVSVTDELLPEAAPSVAVAMVGPASRLDERLASRVRTARQAGLLILPVVDDLRSFMSQVPESLSKFNGFEWSGPNPEKRLAATLLEQLGIEERDRRLFISHKRSDGQGAAEQLHDSLTRLRFQPFIDRFAISPGADVQVEIADALENHAFLLVLETPEAHLSDWVFDEVDYALAHAMGLLILQWPNSPTPIPGSVGLTRIPLSVDDLELDSHNFEVLTAEAVERVVREVEAAHANGLVRRRRMLLRGIQEQAEGVGATCTPLKDWALDITGADRRSIVMAAPRLPKSQDLRRLDEARNEIDPTARALLVHAARRIEGSRKHHLDWIRSGRNLRMLPYNGIGGEW